MRGRPGPGKKSYYWPVPFEVLAFLWLAGLVWAVLWIEGLLAIVKSPLGLLWALGGLVG